MVPSTMLNSDTSATKKRRKATASVNIRSDELSLKENATDELNVYLLYGFASCTALICRIFRRSTTQLSAET